MSAPIKDRTLWDSLGNYCRIELHQIGLDTFELCLHDFNDAVPRLYRGSLGLIINVGDHWFNARIKAGFQEAQPQFNHDTYRV